MAMYSMCLHIPWKTEGVCHSTSSADLVGQFGPDTQEIRPMAEEVTSFQESGNMQDVLSTSSSDGLVKQNYKEVIRYELKTAWVLRDGSFPTDEFVRLEEYQEYCHTHLVLF
ncbi:hypothetical protein Bbelb_444580 [Branchiostoma belcheri]|nr:hypothetical protein Bbelb_444580 [Branchiostoma belcheri]